MRKSHERFLSRRNRITPLYSSPPSRHENGNANNMTGSDFMGVYTLSPVKEVAGDAHHYRREEHEGDKVGECHQAIENIRNAPHNG